MRVLAYGEILWDIIEGVEHLGGAPFNFAAHSAQCGDEAFIISRLGSDFLGMRAFNKCNSSGVDTSFIQWDDDYPTGTVLVTLKGGQPDYTIQENVAYDYIKVDHLIGVLQNRPFDVFYFGTLSQRRTTSAASLRAILGQCVFKHIFYDVNLRKAGYTESIIRESLKLCTVFKLNADEVPVISKMLVDHPLTNEEFCKCIVELYSNVKTIIITASEKGCYVFDHGSLTYVPGVPISVVDAVGAGDAFSAAFMHSFCKTANAVSAASTANQIGAYVATKSGAIPEYSSEIREILKSDFQHSSNATQNIL
jgi:fructokinase